jgi:hypothetical protein
MGSGASFLIQQIGGITVANSVYTFANSNGQTIVFDPLTDVLQFDSSFSAAGLKLVQGPGTGANATVTVTNGAISVVLKGVTIGALRAGALGFADGSIALIGDATANLASDAPATISRAPPATTICPASAATTRWTAAPATMRSCSAAATAPA